MSALFGMNLLGSEARGSMYDYLDELKKRKAVAPAVQGPQPQNPAQQQRLQDVLSNLSSQGVTDPNLQPASPTTAVDMMSERFGNSRNVTAKAASALPYQEPAPKGDSFLMRQFKDIAGKNKAPEQGYYGEGGGGALGFLKDAGGAAIDMHKKLGQLVTGPPSAGEQPIATQPTPQSAIQQPATPQERTVSPQLAKLMEEYASNPETPEQLEQQLPAGDFSGLGQAPQQQQAGLALPDLSTPDLNQQAPEALQAPAQQQAGERQVPWEQQTNYDRMYARLDGEEKNALKLGGITKSKFNQYQRDLQMSMRTGPSAKKARDRISLVNARFDKGIADQRLKELQKQNLEGLANVEGIKGKAQVGAAKLAAQVELYKAQSEVMAADKALKATQAFTAEQNRLELASREREANAKAKYDIDTRNAKSKADYDRAESKFLGELKEKTSERVHNIGTWLKYETGEQGPLMAEAWNALTQREDKKSRDEKVSILKEVKMMEDAKVDETAIFEFLTSKFANA